MYYVHVDMLLKRNVLQLNNKHVCDAKKLGEYEVKKTGRVKKLAYFVLMVILEFNFKLG